MCAPRDMNVEVHVPHGILRQPLGSEPSTERVVFSAPDLSAYEPDPGVLVPVFDAITVDRDHAAEVPPGTPVQRGEPAAARVIHLRQVD